MNKAFGLKNSTFPIVTTTEGVLNSIDLITKNYINKYNNTLKIVSSVSYMDTLSTKQLIFNSIITLMIITLVPLGMAGYFPVFLSSLINE